MIETAADLAPKAQLPAVVYADHSRPEQNATPPDQGATTGGVISSIEPTPIRRFPPDWASGVARLSQQQRPVDVPQHRWQLFLDDCERFLDQREGWADRAAAISWDVLSLFDCCSVRPLDYLGSAGLLWNVAGGKLNCTRTGP